MKTIYKRYLYDEYPFGLKQYEIEPIEGDHGYDDNGVRCYYTVPVSGTELKWVPVYMEDAGKTLVGPITITLMSFAGGEKDREKINRLHDKLNAAEAAYRTGMERRNEQRLTNAKKL